MGWVWIDITHCNSYADLAPITDMSPDRFDNTIQFRASAAQEAADALDTVRSDGINRGELSEEAARILLGDEIDQIREDTGRSHVLPKSIPTSFLLTDGNDSQPQSNRKPQTTNQIRYLESLRSARPNSTAHSSSRLTRSRHTVFQSS
jgi:hypothetical protein